MGWLDVVVKFIDKLEIKTVLGASAMGVLLTVFLSPRLLLGASIINVFPVDNSAYFEWFIYSVVVFFFWHLILYSKNRVGELKYQREQSNESIRKAIANVEGLPLKTQEILKGFLDNKNQLIEHYECGYDNSVLHIENWIDKKPVFVDIENSDGEVKVIDKIMVQGQYRYRLKKVIYDELIDLYIKGLIFDDFD